MNSYQSNGCLDLSGGHSLQNQTLGNSFPMVICACTGAVTQLGLRQMARLKKPRLLLLKLNRSASAVLLLLLSACSSLHCTHESQTRQQLCHSTCSRPSASNSFSGRAVKVKVANAAQHCQSALMLMQAQQGLLQQQTLPASPSQERWSPQGPAVGDTTLSQAEQAHAEALMQEVSEAMQQVHMECCCKHTKHVLCMLKHQCMRSLKHCSR